MKPTDTDPDDAPRCSTPQPSHRQPEEADVTDLSTIARAYTDADRADEAAGPDQNDLTRATERARSQVLEALAHAVPCKTCGATDSGCRGNVAYTDPLWGLDHMLPLHRARIDAINAALRPVGGSLRA